MICTVFSGLRGSASIIPLFVLKTRTRNNKYKYDLKKFLFFFHFIYFYLFKIYSDIFLFQLTAEYIFHRITWMTKQKKKYKYLKSQLGEEPFVFAGFVSNITNKTKQKRWFRKKRNSLTEHTFECLIITSLRIWTWYRP